MVSPESSLDDIWQSRACNTIQEYFQAAYGKLDGGKELYAFRGATRHFCNLRASIDRREITTDSPAEVETRLLEEFFLRAWNDLRPQERRRCLLAELRWGSRRNTGAMVVARHRMVPTRCIDWTYDPLCSLLFACEEDATYDGEVWWFNRSELDQCVGKQWRDLFGKSEHVEGEIEKDYIEGRAGQWFTALNYMLLADDRLDRQRAWITVAGQLGACHAREIHRLGVCDKGRLVIPARLKVEAIALLRQMGITRESLGFAHDDPADKIAARIEKDFKEEFPAKI